MHYLKARCDLGDGFVVDDYFEVDADGFLQRMVSHADGKWWYSADGHGDELPLGDVDPDRFIDPAEFERVWHLARASVDGLVDVPAPRIPV
jgi:hypothetical protein